MNAATITATEYRPTPVWRARMRCHATWYTSAAAPLRKKQKPTSTRRGSRAGESMNRRSYLALGTGEGDIGSGHQAVSLDTPLSYKISLKKIDNPRLMS